MSNVLALDTVATTESTREQRMRLLSWALAWVFTVLLGVALAFAAAAAVVSLIFPQYIQIGASGAVLIIDARHNFVPGDLQPGMVWLSSQPLLIRIAGIADVTIATVPLVFVALNLRGLFRLYASGVVFAQTNARHLKRIGLWLIVYPFAKVGANMVYQLFGGLDKAWFSSLLFYALLLGAVVFVIAQVMAMGHEIEREQAEFV